MDMEWNGRSVLVVDTDLERGNEITSILQESGASVFSANSSVDATEIIHEQELGLIILDATMSGGPGPSCCQEIRHLTESPILIVAAANQTRLVIRAMNSGADDYLLAPVDAEVLLLRVWAALHRARQTNGSGVSLFDDGYLQVDLVAHQVSINGVPIRLTATEYALLTYLLKRDGQVCTFEELLMNVWGSDYSNRSQYIHVFVWHLRQKIEPDPKNPTYLVSEHSIGYRFQGDSATIDGID